MIYVSPEQSPLVMRYQKVLRSAQGMAIWGDLAFVLHHTGYCAVYDLESRCETCLTQFPLGSYNDGVPSAEYTNHSNQCMFSGTCLDGNPIPLLYVTAGNHFGEDENGYYYRCAVENIVLNRDEEGNVSGSSTLIQTISYKNDGIEDTPFESPCFGCPAWFADSEKGYLYIFSARYRTTAEFLPFYEKNRYIITKFKLPSPTESSFVLLHPKDILDQFLTPFDILFTQGGTLKDDKIYYTFGLGNEQYPLGMRVFDLKNKCICQEYDLTGSSFGAEEIECCAFYKGELLCNTNAPVGGIYSLGSLHIE